MMFALALVQVLLRGAPVALGEDVSSSSKLSVGGLIDPDLPKPRRLLPHPGEHNDGAGGLLPHPHNANGHVSSEHGYQGCLGLNEAQLTSVTIGGALASELSVTALPPCEVVVGENTVVFGIDSSSGGGGGPTSDHDQSSGSSNESSSGSGSSTLTEMAIWHNDTTSSNANDGGSNQQDEPTSNTYLEQDESYDATSGSSNPYNISSNEREDDDEVSSGSDLDGKVSQSSSGSDESSYTDGNSGSEIADEADGTSSSTQAEQIYGRFPLRYFNITQCATYSSLWIWDLALTCNSTVASIEREHGCECTSAEILYLAGDIDCESPAQQVCPEDCEVCKTCLRLIGCDNSDVAGEANASIAQVASRSMKENALPMSVAIAASLVTVIVGVNMYQQRKRHVANEELQSALQEDEQDEPPLDPMV